MEGMLSVNDFKHTQIKKLGRTRVQEYVNHFSAAADLIELSKGTNKGENAMQVFANALKARVDQNIKKMTLSEKINQEMQKANYRRQQMQNIGMRQKKTEFSWGKYRKSIY